MKDREKQEEKNKRIGWLTSLGVQLFLLVLFYFLIAWKAPVPPIPEYGIELGFESSAGLQATTKSDQHALPEQANKQAEVAQDNVPDPAENPSENRVEQDVDLIEDNETLAEAMEEAPATREESEKPKTEEIVDENTRKQNEVERLESEDEPVIDKRAIYGRQGSNTGTTEGASLALAGWIWDVEPNPADDSPEVGKVMYNIVVDQEGYLVSIETITSTVSPAVERKYRRAVEKLRFSKTSDYKPATLSTGTLTFIIKSR